MPGILYVGLQDEDKIAVFALEGDSGELTKRADAAATGGPSVVAIGPDRNTLYVGCRRRPSIASYRIEPATGSLSLLGTAAQVDAPTFLAPDRTGRYMLCAYYQGGYVAVYPIAADGTIDAAPIDKQETAVGAHAIATDPSNRFAFVPHIARIQDNVLEPPKNNPGPNVILQYRFNAQTGRLSPNTPHRVEQRDLIGPRHYIHHPSLDVVYFSNEQGCSVTAYRLDGRCCATTPGGSDSPKTRRSQTPAARRREFAPTLHGCVAIHWTRSRVWEPGSDRTDQFSWKRLLHSAGTP